MKIRKNWLIWVLVVGAFAGIVSTARAQLTWDWTYTSQTPLPAESGIFSSFSGSGTLTTGTTETNGFYTITSISGTWSITTAVAPFETGAQSITGLALNFVGSDHLLSASGGQLDASGLAFGLSNGNQVQMRNVTFADFATEFSGTNPSNFTQDYLGDAGANPNPAVTFTAVEVAPEPSSWVLGVAAFGLLFYLRRQRAKS
jgi:MYXO-CTERM domain-containing protein